MICPDCQWCRGWETLLYNIPLCHTIAIPVLMGTQKVLQRQKLKICSQIMACLNENMLGSYEISHLQRVYNNIVRHLIY